MTMSKTLTFLVWKIICGCKDGAGGIFSQKEWMFYFELKEDRLYYVEKEGDLIDPESTKRIVLTLDTNIKRHDENKEHYISLQISKTEKYKLKMENEEECTKCHDAITKALKKL